MFGLYVTTIVIALAASLYFYFRSVYRYWNNRSVPGPKPIPFFGNIKESALRQKHVGVLYQDIYKSYPNEKYVGIYRMLAPTLLIRDLDVVKQILIKDFEAFPDRGFEFSKEGLGDNLFHCDPIAWKSLRGHMTPLFTPGKLKNIVNVLNICGDKFLDHVEDVCLKHPEQEVMQLFLKYTAASIMACSFSINVDSIYENSIVFEEIDKSIFKLGYVNELDLIFPGILRKTNLSLFNETVNRFCYEVVETVKFCRNGNTGIANDVMDILLGLVKQSDVRLNKGYEKEDVLKVTDHVMAGQVFVFFAAGSGNNTNTLSYAMYHLAKNPEIQDKLYAEINDVLERFNGKVTDEGIKEMTYLEKVFNETLRMHPTTNAIQRSAGREYTFPGTDLKIDKGVSIVISPMAIQHDEKLYPNPQQFDPERFAPEAVKDRHSCAFLPFGAGPRTCLGTRFAKAQFKVCVAKLLSKFRVEVSRRTKDTYDINPHRSLLCPMGGIYLKFIPRSLLNF